MRDAGYARRRGEGGDPQRSAAHPQLTTCPFPANQQQRSRRQAVANGAGPSLLPPPSLRCGSGTTAVTAALSIPPARSGYLRAPLAVSSPCAFAPARATLAWSEETEKTKWKKLLALITPCLPPNSSESKPGSCSCHTGTSLVLLYSSSVNIRLDILSRVWTSSSSIHRPLSTGHYIFTDGYSHIRRGPFFRPACVEP